MQCEGYASRNLDLSYNFSPKMERLHGRAYSILSVIPLTIHALVFVNIAFNYVIHTGIMSLLIIIAINSFQLSKTVIFIQLMQVYM